MSVLTIHVCTFEDVGTCECNVQGEIKFTALQCERFNPVADRILLIAASSCKLLVHLSTSARWSPLVWHRYSEQQLIRMNPSAAISIADQAVLTELHRFQTGQEYVWLFAWAWVAARHQYGSSTFCFRPRRNYVRHCSMAFETMRAVEVFVHRSYQIADAKTLWYA